MLFLILLGLFFVTINGKPNLLVFVVDDMLDAMFHEDLQEEIPNLTDLKHDSIRYTNMMAMVPHCGPSRMSFMTGRYNTNFRYSSDSKQQEGYYLHDGGSSGYTLEREVIYSSTLGTTGGKPTTFVNWLKGVDSSYKIYGTSKLVHHGRTIIPHSQSSIGHNACSDSTNNQMKFDKYCYENTEAKVTTRDLPAVGSLIEPPFGGESTDFDSLTRVVEMINNHISTHGSNVPFAMLAGFRKPHVGYHIENAAYTELKTTSYYSNLPPLGMLSTQDELTFTPVCDGLGSNVQGVPFYYGDASSIDFNPATEVKTAGTSARLREYTENIRKMYMRTVRQTDHHVGEVLTLLKTHGIYDNTVIVFMSDHGFHLGEYGRWCKRSLYDASARVPFLLKPSSYHDGPQNVTDPHSLTDMFRLITSYMDLPQTFDSDYKRTTTRPDLPPFAVTINVICEDPNNPGVNLGCEKDKLFKYTHLGFSIRTSKWRYVEVRRFTSRKIDWVNAPVKTELYYVENGNDPDNIVNLLHPSNSHLNTISEEEMNELKYFLFEELDVCKSFVGSTSCGSVNGGYCSLESGQCVTNESFNTNAPTTNPTLAPTGVTKRPTGSPTPQPTRHPTASPTQSPIPPTEEPTTTPTSSPTTVLENPTVSSEEAIVSYAHLGLFSVALLSAFSMVINLLTQGIR